MDEYTVFRETFKRFFELGYEKPLIVLADAGPYSIEILDWIFNMGIIPLINSKKSIKNQNIEKLDKYYYINMDYIPKDWTDEQILMLMIIRIEIERQFSYNILVYHARRANVRGIEMLSKHQFKILILDLFKINTAYKIGRPNMIGKSSIFTMTRSIAFYSIFPPLAQQAGYQLLLSE